MRFPQLTRLTARASPGIEEAPFRVASVDAAVAIAIGHIDFVPGCYYGLARYIERLAWTQYRSARTNASSIRWLPPSAQLSEEVPVGGELQYDVVVAIRNI